MWYKMTEITVWTDINDIFHISKSSLLPTKFKIYTE